MCLQSPPPNNIRLVHWEQSITTSDHCYQLCPLGDLNHHIWSLLLVLSIERPQSSHLITLPMMSTERGLSPNVITGTSVVHWQTSITASDQCYQFFLLREPYHQMWSLLPVLSAERLHSPNLTNATDCIHWEKLITTSDHCYPFCPLTAFMHLIWPMLPVVSIDRPQSPHLITATSFVPWEKLITIYNHCYMYQLCPLTDIIHHIWSLLPVLLSYRPQPSHIITTVQHIAYINNYPLTTDSFIY
jgi:hypothetical protein